MLEGTVVFIVPELLFYEMANALRYNPNLSANDVNEALDSILDVGFEVRRVDKRTIEDAINIALNMTLPSMTPISSHWHG
jgi:hypothetical protein